MENLRPLSLLGIVVATLLLCIPTESEAKTHRSYAVKAEFKRLNRCPTNGNRRGPCPGYEVDRIVPLKCKGTDAVDHMQWLAVEEHKAKTKREAGMCRRP